MTKKNLAIAGSAVVALILLLTVVSARGDKMSVRSDVARHEDIVNTIVTNGKIEPDEDFQAHAPLATTVKKIFVHEGDVVKKGQPLVRLDDADARATAAKPLAHLRGCPRSAEQFQHKSPARRNGLCASGSRIGFCEPGRSGRGSCRPQAHTSARIRG